MEQFEQKPVPLDIQEQVDDINDKIGTVAAGTDLQSQITTINGKLVHISFDSVTLPFKASHDGILWFFWRVDVSGTGRTYVQVTGALLDFYQINGAYCNGFVPVQKGQEIAYIGSYGVQSASLGITFVNFNN